MFIKIIDKFSFQNYPLDDTAIEVDDETLSQIGVTKCFDTVNNAVIDYDNSKDLKFEEIEAKINELKQALADTDYKAIKYLEGEMSVTEYQPTKILREGYRLQINNLQAELEKLK